MQELDKIAVSIFTSTPQWQTLTSEKPQVLNNSQEYLSVGCFLLLMLLAQELTNVSEDLLLQENESLMCLTMALA